MNDKNTESQTHFGYQSVSVEEKERRVADVFHSVANRYDLMNDLMSFGIHRLWKHLTVEMSAIRTGQTVLDLAAGTGDLALKMARLTGPSGHVVLADINESMLRLGRDKLIDQGYCHNTSYVQANAESLPFEKNRFDLVTMAFGLRNVTDKQAALASIHRVLKPGGRLLVLEFSKPKSPLFAKLYDAYSFTLLPFMGKLVTDSAESYRYLAESIRMHPDQSTLKGMMEQAGLGDVAYHNLSGGIVALHRGIKP